MFVWGDSQESRAAREPRPSTLVLLGGGSQGSGEDIRMATTIQHGSAQVAAKVVYEITMFRHAFDSLLQLEVDLGHIQPGHVMPRVGTGINTTEVIEASVFVECFLLHARVLRDFFCSSGYKPDDVTAGEFVSGWSAPPVSDYHTLDGEKERLNKALAHLTTTRVQYETNGKEWNLAAIRQELEDIIRLFLASLPTDKAAWFGAVR